LNKKDYIKKKDGKIKDKDKNINSNNSFNEKDDGIKNQKSGINELLKVKIFIKW